MKKFHFSLQRLLHYKEQLFDVERGVLADMNARLGELRREQEALQSELQTGSAALRQKYAEGITALEIMQHKIYLESVGEGIIQKEREIEFQLQAIDRQTDKVREAKIEISTMEKLREKKQEEYSYLENKEQDQFIEEFVSNQKATAIQA